LEASGPPGAGPKLPKKGDIVMLQTKEGVRPVPISRIQEIIFRGEPKAKVAHEEFRNLLTLRLDWGAKEPPASAAAGLVYLQKGIRWIPNYRVEVGEKGTARVRLQATLLNEMTDLKGVTAHLVIGVPTFRFKETLDPMGLQQTVAQLSPYFRQDARTAYAFSNVLMTQTARMREVRAPQPRTAAPSLGPALPGAGKAEDLFVFTVENVSLRKGERMVLPIAEYTLPATDVYTLDIPFAPPVEVRRRFNSSQQAELARLFHAPKVMHKIRLVNKSRYPLTTAPALIVRNGRALGQGMMTYTAIGGTSDLAITTAVDVHVSRSDDVTKKTPNAAHWRGDAYDRFDLAGRIALVNHLDRPIALEVTRKVLGNADEADHDGRIVKTSVFDEPAEHPHWWRWYSWPYWWRHFNGIDRITWTLALEPGKRAELKYAWHYFWR
jgi:hypothetical protein